MKKKILIIAAIALVVIIGVVVTVLAIMNTPDKVAMRALSGMADDLLARKEIKPISQVLTGGSVQFSIEDISSEGESILPDAKIAGKLYFSQDALMISNFETKVGEFKVAGDAYISSKEFYIKEDHILDDTYGVKFSRLAAELKKSIFAPDSESKYALDEETYDTIISALEDYEDNEKLNKDAQKLAEKLVKDLWEIVVEHVEITSENTQRRLNGKQTNVRMITIAIDADAMKNIIADAYEYLYNSDDIIDFLEKHEDSLSGLIDDEEYESVVEAYEDWIEGLDEYAEQLCDSIDDDFDTIKVNIITPRTSSTLLKLEVKSGLITVFSLDCGEKGIEKTKEINIEMGETKISYEILKDSKNEFKSVCKVTLEGEDPFKISLEIDKKKEKYSLVFDSTTQKYDYSSGDYYNAETYSATNKFTVKGKWSTNDDTTTITIDKITHKYSEDRETNSIINNDYENTIEMDCNIVIDTDDKMPTPQEKYKTLSDITEKDIDKWIDKISDALNQ